MSSARTVLLVVLLFGTLLILFGALGLPPVLARGLSRDGVAAIVLVTMIARIIYFTSLFLVAPQGIFLRVLHVRNLSIFLLVGVLSGWFFLSVVALSADWFATAARAQSVGEATAAFFGTMALRPAGVAHAIWFAAGPFGLFFAALFGAFFGWLWQLPTYRLPGDAGRDWETRVLGKQPPYSG
jgi:hypothetical protein